MSYATVSYTTDGVTELFNVPFPYIAKSDVKVFLSGVSVAFEWHNNSVVKLSPAPSVGLTVRISRTTPITSRLVDFQNGTTLTEFSLDKDGNQAFFLVQEMKDDIDSIVAGQLAPSTITEIVDDAANSVLLHPDFTQVQADAAQGIVDAATAQSAADAAQAAADAAQVTADGKINTFFAADAPTADGVGDLWIETDNNNHLYRWSGSSWVDIHDPDIAQAIADAATAQSTADGKIVSFYQTGAPTAEGVGDLWIDTDDGNKLYRWNGSSWLAVQDAAIAAAQADASQAITDAANAQSAADAAQGTADGKVTTFFAAAAPTAEGVGDLWIETDNNNHLWRWSGAAWVDIHDPDIAQAITDAATAQATADGKIVTFYQAAQPTATSVGDLWVDTDDGNKLYRWSGTTWESAQDSAIAAAQADASQAITDAANAQSAADAAQATADGKVTTFFAAAAPAADGVGDLWIETDNNNHLWRWSGTAWVDIHDPDIAQAITDAATAQATADGKIVSFYQAAQPTADGVGDLWVDTDDGNKLYRWDGAAWQSVQDASIAAAQADASQAITDAATAQAAADAAQATADGKVVTFFSPTQPTADGVGDLWIETDNNNHLWRWNGTSWADAHDPDIAQAITDAATAQATADGKITTFYQAAAPTAEGEGDYWIDTDDGSTYRWNGSSWVSLQQWRVFAQTTAPVSPDIGDVWYDTDDKNKSYQWDGAAWQPLVTTIDGSLVVNGTIVGDHIATSTITAAKLSVTTLSSITADFGTMTAEGVVTFYSTGGTDPRMVFTAEGTYPLWFGSGAINDANAVFFVKDDGTAKFAGDLSAAGGSFTGSLTAATGSFAGSLSAATGTFAGTLTAAAVNAVDTINVAGNAITIPVSAYTAGQITSNGWVTIQSATLIATGQPVQIGVAFSHDGNGSSASDTFGVRVRRDTTDIYSVSGLKTTTNTQKEVFAATLSDTPAAGSHTYYLQVDFTSNYPRCSNRSVTLLETKK